MKVYLSQSVAERDGPLIEGLVETGSGLGVSLFKAPRPWEPRTTMPPAVREAILASDLFLVWAMAGGESLYFVNMEMSFVRNIRPRLPVFVVMDKNAPRSGFLQLPGGGSRCGGFWFDPPDLKWALGHAHHLAHEHAEFMREMEPPFRAFLGPAIASLYRHLGWRLHSDGAVAGRSG